MKIEYLYLDGYKGLKNFSVSFREQQQDVSLNLLIGRNGSGKSTLLEAVGLIFTRVMQNELPGFDFKIKYRMSNGARVQIQPGRGNAGEGKSQKLDVRIEEQGVTRFPDGIPGEYLPDRIVSYCSGANGMMEEILISSPRDSLASDLYDLMLEEEEAGTEMVEGILQYYEQLDVNPRALYLDASTSRFILPVLFAILPLELQENGELVREYGSLRSMLADQLSIRLIPVAFSIRVDEEKLEASGDMPQMNILRKLLGPLSDDRKNTADFIVRREGAGSLDSEGDPAMETTAVFLYQPYGKADASIYYHPRLQNFFDGNPFVFLSVLLAAYREDVISDINFVFRKKDEKGLYGVEALSDGEFMWMARMGLVLMAQEHCGKDTLFLFDEPDVHFNDDWNMNFVKTIYKLSRNTCHGFFVATHSTLILTDAMHEQITLFEQEDGKGIRVHETGISTFAAQRDEISKRCFGTGSIGAYAADFVRDVMEERNLEKMKEKIDRLGPGYQRFRLWEQFYSLLDGEQE